MSQQSQSQSPQQSQFGNPLLALAKVLNDDDVVNRLNGAAEMASIPAIRLYLLAAEWPWRIPPGDTPDVLVRSFLMCGWQAIPSGLTEPRSGDLVVTTDPDTRTPVKIGIVVKVHTEGKYIKIIRDGEMDTVTDLLDIDYWLRMPCKPCDEAEARKRAIIDRPT